MKAKKQPIFTNTGCQLEGYMNPSSPRCQTQYLKWACYNSAQAINDTTITSFIIPESDHSNAELPPQPWILTARNAFVSVCGYISSKCGLVHTTANCKAIAHELAADSFHAKCPASLVTKNAFEQAYAKTKHNGIPTLKNGTCMHGAPFTQEFEYHDKVFVVAEVDDSYVYHLHLEIIPRLVYHLEFLQAHPEMKILIGCDTKKTARATEMGMHHMLLSMKPLMDLAGLSMNRLIVHKHVFAREVYLPMEGGCQDPVYNTWQILSMRKRFFHALNITQPSPGGYEDYQHSHSIRRSLLRENERKNGKGGGKRKNKRNVDSKEISTENVNKKPVLLLMKRSTGAKHTRNAEDLVRQWNDNFTNRLMAALKKTFPTYDVKIFSDKDEALMGCHACQIRAFAEADVLIGMHGAGLSNQLYMKPNSAVIELW